MKKKTITKRKMAKHAITAAILGLGLALTACTSTDEADGNATTPGTQQEQGQEQGDGGSQQGQEQNDNQGQSDNLQNDNQGQIDDAPEIELFEPERDLAGFINFAPTDGALANQLAPPAIGEEFAIIHTNFGEIHLRLFPDIAPMAVQNFTTHANDGFFDNLIFHRIIPNFMLQGGCSLGTGFGGQSIWGRGFGDEVTTNLRHIRGALSMANTGMPFSNSSQFFIVHNHTLNPNDIHMNTARLEAQDMRVSDGEGYLYDYLVSDVWPAEWMQHYIDYGGTPHLDYGHTVFGHVFYGMDVVDAIAAVGTEGGEPLEDVVIYRIEIVTKD